MPSGEASSFDRIGVEWDGGDAVLHAELIRLVLAAGRVIDLFVHADADGEGPQIVYVHRVLPIGDLKR